MLKCWFDFKKGWMGGGQEKINIFPNAIFHQRKHFSGGTKCKKGSGGSCWHNIVGNTQQCFVLMFFFYSFLNTGSAIPDSA